MTDQKRPISHLLRRPLIAYGYIETWDRPKDGDYGMLLKRVELFDFESGKSKLAPTLDHCWLWIPDLFWDLMHPALTAFNQGNRIHDRVRFVGEVRGYTRSNGSHDFGLSLRNELPVAAAAQKTTRTGNSIMAKNRNRIALSEIVDRWIQQDLYRKQILRALGDWGDCGISMRDAIGNCASNQAALEREFELRTAYSLPAQKKEREIGLPPGDPILIAEYADHVIADQCRKLQIEW
jgi:hypothetical protein